MPYEYKFASYKFSLQDVTDLHHGGTPLTETVMCAAAQQTHRKRYPMPQNKPKNKHKMKMMRNKPLSRKLDAHHPVHHILMSFWSTF
jgi:hypothetical protein